MRANAQRRGVEENKRKDLRDSYRQQEVWRTEGESAAREGKRRADCPYDNAVNMEAWQFWVYGCENEAGRIEWEKNGRPMCST